MNNKSIEELRKDYINYRLEKEGSTGVQTDATPYIEGYNKDFDWFLPHLNSRNLLKKKLNYLNMRILKLKKGSKKYDYYSAQRFLIKELLDEFIESELHDTN